MVNPKVTVIWLNYNSMDFINLVIESLESLFDIDYPNYEIIIVDNDSSDGSFNIIKDYAKRRCSSVNIKVIRLNKNKGWCKGINIGFRARDRSSKYVVVLNNDVVVYSESLSQLVEEFENDSKLGGIQGVIIDYDHGCIDTAGGMLDELINQHHLLRGSPISAMRKPYYITYADGSYAMYRVDVLLKVNNSEKIFEDILFAYWDDALLGLRLWNNGYKIKSIPVVVAKHRRSSSFGKITELSPLRLYLMLRNKLFLISITNSKYKYIAYILNIMYYFILSLIKRIKATHVKYLHVLARAIHDSFYMMKYFKTNTLNLYKAPAILFGSKYFSIYPYLWVNYFKKFIRDKTN